MLKLIKRLLLPAVLCFTVHSTMAAEAIDTNNPYKMIEQVANHTFSRFNSDQAKIKADPNYLKTIVREELLPYVDYNYASLKVLGKNVQSLQRKLKDRNKVLSKIKEFTGAFKGYMVSTYASAFTQYTHQKVQFSPAKKFAGQKFVIVPVQVIDQGRPPIKMAFKMRRQKDNSWKVYDLIAEGVSLIQSKQSEIGGLVQRQGFDNVIKMLNDKANADVSKKSEQ